MNSQAFPTKTDIHAAKKKMVGTYITEEDANRFAMLSLINSTPRSFIFGKLIDGYLKGKPSLDKMVKKAAKTALKTWEDIVFVNTDQKGWINSKDIQSRFESYLGETKADLKRHRIDIKIITRILTEVRNDYNPKKQ